MVTLRALAVAAAVAAALTATPAAAVAADGRTGVRETVCATDLFVRTQPNGAWMGTLSSGQTFLVEGPRSGGYVYGFAYGHINRRGWVQDGWFC
jgi:ABC-type sugar transport system substrate-binding protein